MVTRYPYLFQSLPAVAILASQDVAKLRFGQPSQFEALDELTRRFRDALTVRNSGECYVAPPSPVFAAARLFDGAAQATQAELTLFVSKYAHELAQLRKPSSRPAEAKLVELQNFCVRFAAQAGRLEHATPA
jgi:hypothetical protein